MQDEQIKEENIVSENTDSKVYELGYLLVPTIKEEDVPINYGNLKELIASFGGEIVADEMPKFLNLAYTMKKVIANINHKFNTAYFGWIKFTMKGEQVLELKKALDLDINLVRFLILKTVRENTIAAKRFVGKDTYKKPRAKDSENEVVVPINKEEIDKEIEAMIAV